MRKSVTEPIINLLQGSSRVLLRVYSEKISRLPKVAHEADAHIKAERYSGILWFYISEISGDDTGLQSINHGWRQY